MNTRIRFTPLRAVRALAPLGLLALAALSACQTDAPRAGVALQAEDASGVELRLVVKDDSACLAARDAFKAGAATDSLRAAFVAACIVEVPDGKPLPPRPLPHDGLRCAWLGAQIDSGRAGLAHAYVRLCAAACDSLAASDTAAYAARCAPPVRDTVKPPRDTTRPALPPPLKALCDSLQGVLAATDTAAAGYWPLAHRTAAVCRLPLPVFPHAPVPPPHSHAPHDGHRAPEDTASPDAGT